MKRSLSQKPGDQFHILRFFLVYALLAGWFYCFIGITSPGGKVYSAFLDNYLNAPRWLTWLISQSSLGILKLAGFNVYQRAPNNVTIIGSRGVSIIWACLGFGVMSFWTAFITSHKGRWQYKLKWCLGGIIIIIALNILRITLIALGNHYHWEAFNALEPHSAFTIASYVVLFLLVVWFMHRYRRMEQHTSPDYSPATHSNISAVTAV